MNEAEDTIDLTRPGLRNLDERIRDLGRRSLRRTGTSSEGIAVAALLRLLDLPSHWRDHVVVATSRDELMRALLTTVSNASPKSPPRPGRLASPASSDRAPDSLARSMGYTSHAFSLARRSGKIAPNATMVNAELWRHADVLYLESPDALGYVESTDAMTGLGKQVQRDPMQKLRLVIADQSGSLLAGGNSDDRKIDTSHLSWFEGRVPILVEKLSMAEVEAVTVFDMSCLPLADRPPTACFAICRSKSAAKAVRDRCPSYRRVENDSIDDAAVFLTGLSRGRFLDQIRSTVRSNAATFDERILKVYGVDPDIPIGRITGGIDRPMMGARMLLPVADFLDDGTAGRVANIEQSTLGSLIADSFSRVGVKCAVRSWDGESHLVFDALQKPATFMRAMDRLDHLLNAPNGLYNSMAQQPRATIEALRSGTFHESVVGSGPLVLDEIALQPSGPLRRDGSRERIALTDGRAVARGRELLGALVHNRSESVLLSKVRRPLCDLLGLGDPPRSQTVVLGGSEDLFDLVNRAIGPTSSGLILDLGDYTPRPTHPSLGRAPVPVGRLFSNGTLNVDRLIQVLRPRLSAVILKDPAILFGESLSPRDLRRIKQRCDEVGILLVIDRSLDVGILGFEQRNKFVIDELVASGNCAFFSDTGPLVAEGQRGTTSDRRVGLCLFPTAELATASKARGISWTDMTHSFNSLALIRAALERREDYFDRVRGEMGRHIPLLHKMGRMAVPRQLFGLSPRIPYGSTPIRRSPLVTDHKTMLVVGAGIAGIAVGLEALARGIPVKIVDDSPPDFTGAIRSGISMAAAAQFLPFMISESPKVRSDVARRVSLSRITYDVLGSQPAKTGVLPIANVELLVGGERWFPEIEQAMRAGVISMDEPLRTTDVGAPIEYERYYQFDGYSINTARTLMFLREAFVEAGGVIEHRTISRDEAAEWDGPVVIAAGDRAAEFDVAKNGPVKYVKGGSIEFRPDIDPKLLGAPAGISGGHTVMLPRVGSNGEYSWVVGGGAQPNPSYKHPERKDFTSLVLDAEGMSSEAIGAWKPPVDAFSNPVAYRTAWRTYNPPGIDMVRREGNAVVVAGLEGTGWTLAFGLARDAVDMACGVQRQFTTSGLLA